MKVNNHKDYARFDYIPYTRNGDILYTKPANLPYDLGDVVYVESQNSVGVVLGCIDMGYEELRTDVDGMVSFSDIELFDPAKHIPLNPRIGSELIQELKLPVEPPKKQSIWDSLNEPQLPTAVEEAITALNHKAGTLIEHRPSKKDGNFNYIHQENVFDLIKEAFMAGYNMAKK